MKKFAWIAGLILVVVLGIVFWWKFYFVFGEGVKAGSLNYFVKKGVVFKTWEGRMVQEGFQSPTSGALQSNEFRFSVTDEEVAAILERNSGKHLELRYEEFNGMLPWRGTSEFVVTEVINSSESAETDGSTLPISK
ncbi:6-phosphogluconate dehydrogenase [Algoriphagus jejuensis]|uniref:6-phosphogluconate dehydrogenase n=1 Tax=Algoriphagus jejuensis TaxID=419934 RepID=A0ABN1N589_9BACT